MHQWCELLQQAGSHAVIEVSGYQLVQTWLTKTGAAVDVDSAADKLDDFKMTDKATNGLSSAKPPQESSRPPPAAPESSKGAAKAEEDEDTEDESARQQRELVLQQVNEELAKEDPRHAILAMSTYCTSLLL